MENPDESNRKFAYQLLEEHFGFFMDKMRENCKVSDEQFDLAKMHANWKTLRKKINEIVPHTELQVWDKFFSKRTGFPKYRNELVHKINYTPPSVNELDCWREQATVFLGFVVATINEYKRQVFTLSELIDNYLNRLKRMIKTYPIDTHIAKDPYFFIDFPPYGELPSLVKNAQSSIRGKKDLRELKPGKLREIINLIDVVCRFEGREYTFLENGTCPQCGGTIDETERASGGSMDDPQPTTIYYRVGCSNCEFTLNEESIGI